MSDSIDMRAVATGRGVDWIRRGFALFRQAPGVWMGIVVIYFLIQMLANMLPLGGLVMQLIGPVFVAGILFGCRDQTEGKELELAHLFAGFRSNRVGPLILLGLFILLLIVLVAALMGGIAAIALGGVDLDSGDISLNGLFSLLLIGLVLIVPVLMAVWFAPQLVALHELDPLPAIKASFVGCSRNIGALTIYGLLLIPLSLLAMIPLGLGLLVLVPTVIAANYCSYVDIYASGAEDEAPPQPSLID